MITTELVDMEEYYCNDYKITDRPTNPVFSQICLLVWSQLFYNLRIYPCVWFYILPLTQLKLHRFPASSCIKHCQSNELINLLCVTKTERERERQRDRERELVYKKCLEMVLRKTCNKIMDLILFSPFRIGFPRIFFFFILGCVFV